MQVVLDFFSYINDMGASVMMPVILTIFGRCWFYRFEPCNWIDG